MTVAWIRGSTILALSTISGVLLWLSACEPYEPVLGGAAFLLPGPHEALACEECHGPPPFEAIVWDTTCLSCHDQDRKDDAAHQGYQTCSGVGCHEATHLTWNEALLAVDHDFLPLEGPHAIECALCHSGATPALDDVIPVGGNSTYCWSCHEVDRKLPEGDPPRPHYIDDPTDPKIVADSELRWDCKACHDQRVVAGIELSPRWFPPAYWHGGPGTEIKVPHGTQAGGVAAPVAVTDPSLWVVACVDCHPQAPDYAIDYTCSDVCHQDVLGIVFHPSTSVSALGDDASCVDAGCHPHADRRPQ